ncbi:MAG: hypothetical protein FD174_1157 [Geobacteraceae bacterium]|nr:MAG: hypothetical protein FD174_1157 [Geobacteraceae bacterium]
MDVKAKRDEWEIACQQVLLQDSSVFSIQWMVVPRGCTATLTPPFLLDKYLAHIRRFTCALIRPAKTAQGIEFRLFVTGLSLISFCLPSCRKDETGEALALDICGGLLVQRQEPRKGELSFQCVAVPEGVKITLQLSDYSPLLLGGCKPSKLRKLLYRLTQAYIHKIVTVKFLARIYRELTGQDVCVRVARVKAREGEET